MKRSHIFILLLLALLSAKEAKLQKSSFIYHSNNNGLNWSSAADGLPAGALVNEFLHFQGQVFAATNEHGLFVSEKGTHWRPIGKNIPRKIKAIASNGNTLFAAPWLGGILVSFDQGKTWQERNMGLFDQEVLSIVNYDKLIFVGTGSGVFLSWNDGQSWMKVLSGVQVNDLVVNGTSIYAASPVGVYQSDDRGKNWNNILEGTEVRSVHSLHNTLYIQTFEDGILRKHDSGNSWTSESKGLPRNGRSSFALSVIGDELWVGDQDDIYRLKSKGGTWEKFQAPWGDGVPVSQIFSYLNGQILVLFSGWC